MKWGMEVDEIEAVLEKIWDLHDKLSDTIHSISRAHFLNSIKNPARKPEEFCFHRKKKYTDDDPENTTGPGFVFMKEFRVYDDDVAALEAKSLYSIRTALENLEDQLEFFHTVQTQQKAERDAAIDQLERSRTILAIRLAAHHGKKYKVIEEAQALVGDVSDASRFVAPDHLFGSLPYPSSEKFIARKGKRPNAVANFLLSSYAHVSKSLKLDHTVGIMGNAALLAVSILALLHLNQIGKESRKVHHLRGASSGDGLLDVMLARG